MKKTILHTKQLTTGYHTGNKDRILFSDLNLELKEGELVALIGENGIGKSTLLKTLAGHLPALAGKVFIQNKELWHWTPAELSRQLSFIGTGWPKVANMTLLDLVAMARYPYTGFFNKLNTNDHKLIDEAIEAVGLNPLRNRLITRISDGERQRALIAHSLAQDTPLIFLDEPTAFLDLPNKFEIVHLLNEICRSKNRSILFSIHDLHIALNEADKLWLLHKNNLIEGAPEDLILNGCIEQAFQSEKVKFNYQSGQFYVKKSKKAKICLTGHGRVFNWTKKALERIDFSVQCNKSNPQVVVEAVSENLWKVKRGDVEMEYNSIYELAFYLKQLKL